MRSETLVSEPRLAAENRRMARAWCGQHAREGQGRLTSTPGTARRDRPYALSRFCARCCALVALCVLVLCAIATDLPDNALAEQASEPTSPAAGRLDAGKYHTCAILFDSTVRCWGYGGSGQLGYGNTDTVGDDETPASAGPVNLGGHGAKAIAAGDYHTCALLDDGSVRCWGYGGDGRLGYGNTKDVSDPSSVGPVDLGLGRSAIAITAGAAHTCAILDDGSVRCWGYGGGGRAKDGRLGYGNNNNVGDTQTPGSVAPVKLGAGRTAKAITAGGAHTCALLDNGNVRCWGGGGFPVDGRLGYGNTDFIGDDETPDTVGPVNLGPGRTAQAISAGDAHTCAILDNGSVRCWGYGGYGRLGYGNVNTIGDDETPDTVGPVNLGPGRTAQAISAGGTHTCARLDDNSVRCWGYGANGRLGYGNTANVGDTPTATPDTVGPVDLGPGRSDLAISAGYSHTCALLDNASVRCWGPGANGRLGYCNQADVGDTPATLPGSVGPVNLEPGDGGAGCASSTGPDGGGSSAAASVGARTQSVAGHRVDPLGLEAIRARDLRSCLAVAARRSNRDRRRARRYCVRRYARTPGRVTGLHARALSSTAVVLNFAAPGTDGLHPPAARGYLLKQSPRRIRGGRAFLAAPSLCHGACRFRVTVVGTRIKLTITHLHRHTVYYYAITARDNVSGRLGPRSPTVAVRTR